MQTDRWTDKMKLLFAILRMHLKIQIFMVEEEITSNTEGEGTVFLYISVFQPS